MSQQANDNDNNNGQLAKELLEKNKFTKYFELEVKIVKMISFLIFCGRRKVKLVKMLKTKFSSKERH